MIKVGMVLTVPTIGGGIMTGRVEKIYQHTLLLSNDPERRLVRLAVAEMLLNEGEKRKQQRRMALC